ncbi:hypothetical protein DFJ74DRAFT_661892 [Hyaloraphidium curvatum]|nr:hypothetical protein DFJ74DRAFT_661892 [Hyaloraphidium curvatum]
MRPIGPLPMRPVLAHLKAGLLLRPARLITKMARVLISGAGTIGPLLAMALKRAGHKPALHDAVASWADVGGGLNLAPNGLRLVRDLGLLDELAAAGTPTSDYVISKIDGRRITSWTAEPWQKAYGMIPIGIRRSRMHELFIRAAERDGVPVHTGKKLKDIQQGGGSSPVVATFEDGTTAEADLMVGCDGLHSQTRALLWGKEPATYTGVSSLIGISTRDDGHIMRGYQGNGLFGGLYGIGKGEVVWFINRAEPDATKAQESWTSDAAAATTHADQLRSLGMPADFVDTVARSSRVIVWAVYDRPAIPQWTKGRVTLAGDAAHPMSPHLGQGANTGLEDAGVLSELLRRIPDDPARAFAVYERLRKSRTAQIVKSARQMGEMNSMTNTIACAVRDAAMAAMIRLLGSPPVDVMHGYDYKKVVEKELG